MEGAAISPKTHLNFVINSLITFLLSLSLSLDFFGYILVILKFVLFVLIQACGCPFYWKSLLFLATGGEKLGHVTFDTFSDFWKK